MDIFLRTVILLLFTIICFRIMGYRSIGDMEPLDFVIVLGIAEIMGAPLVDDKLPTTNAFIAIATLTLLQLVMAYVSMKSKFFLKLIEGTPVEVVRDGQVLKDNLAKTRFTYSELMEELRLQGLDGLENVHIATLEPSGRFSVIEKETTNQSGPGTLANNINQLVLVQNGYLQTDQLNQSGVTPAQLMHALTNAGVLNIADVETALLLPSGNIAIAKKQGQPNTL